MAPQISVLSLTSASRTAAIETTLPQRPVRLTMAALLLPRGLFLLHTSHHTLLKCVTARKFAARMRTSSESCKCGSR